MLLASRRAGFTEDELLATGLAQRSKSNPGRVYDRFRSRVMFPSADVRGRVCGFGARAMSGGDRVAKYVNSPDGELYHKRGQLFGIDRARGAATKADRMILVEGYTDVLALHQAGMPNSVAIMGTSFTEEQLGVLEKHVHVLELCLDADSAGHNAVLKAASLAAGRNMELRVVVLPEGLDPADLLQADGAESLRARVSGSVPFAEFRVDRILGDADSGSAEQRDRAIAEIAPVLGQVPPSVLRDELVQRISGRLGLSEGRLASLLADGASTASVPTVRPRRAAGGPTLDQDGRNERTFLVQCVAVPDAGGRVLAEIDPDQVFTSELMRRAARHIAPRPESPLSDIPEDDGELARAIADLVARAGKTPDVSAGRLMYARLVLERSRLDRAIRRARADRGMNVSALARQRAELMDRMSEVLVGLQKTM
jgi:DNA primase